MGTIIYRGSTPTIKFKPLNGVSVSDLGTPTIAVAQELVYITPEVTINTSDNSISCKLTEEETLSLVEGVPTSAQQIWAAGENDIIRYPVHKLTVAETIMEEFNSQPQPEPTEELANLHPFMVYSPFEEEGYFDPYFDDGGASVETWAAATTPYADYISDFSFRYNALESPELADFIMLPLGVSSISNNATYKLWVNVTGSDELTLTFEVGGGYSFQTINGETTTTITITNSDQLITLVGSDAYLNQMMFKLRVRTLNATGENTIGFALYEEVDGVPESEYKQYRQYDGGAI